MLIRLRYNTSCLVDKLLCILHIHKWNLKQDDKPIKGTFCIRCGIKAIHETDAEKNGRIMAESLEKREQEYNV